MQNEISNQSTEYIIRPYLYMLVAVSIATIFMAGLALYSIFHDEYWICTALFSVMAIILFVQTLRLIPTLWTYGTVHNYTPPKGWCIAFSEGSSPEAVIFRSHGLLQSNRDATLPLRWLPPAALLWTCHLGTPCAASCSQPTSFIKYAIFSIGSEV